MRVWEAYKIGPGKLIQWEKQEETKKFDLGEISGRKLDRESVAKAMMAARDSEGNRFFTSTEFLTSQQVASFFSRLAAKRRLPDVTSGSDKKADDAETESALH